MTGAAVALAIALLAPPPKRDETYRLLDAFVEAYGQIRERWVEPVDDRALIEGAIRGMVEALDAHSEFLPPDLVREFRDTTRGRYAGVGIEIGHRGGRLLVVAPIDGTPASRAGIRAGDVILAVDGHDAGGMALVDAIRRLRGEAGSEVTLRLQRRDGEVYTVVLRREVVVIDSVEGELIEPAIVHIRLRAFQEDTGDDLEATVEALKAKAGGKLEGIVLDLRNNPGGLVDEAVAVADLFLEHGDIVRTVGRDDQANRTWRARRPGTLAGVPMVIIVNAGSASAAEIVAGALQDHRRGIVVGTPTFGKGSVQSLIELPGGGGLKLTIAQYFTPSGRSIQATGIVPDVRIEAADEVVTAPAASPEGASIAGPVREADLSRHLENPTGAKAPPPPAPPSPDPTLSRAVELLRAARILGGER